MIEFHTAGWVERERQREFLSELAQAEHERRQRSERSWQRLKAAALAIAGLWCFAAALQMTALVLR